MPQMRVGDGIRVRLFATNPMTHDCTSSIQWRTSEHIVTLRAIIIFPDMAAMVLPAMEQFANERIEDRYLVHFWEQAPVSSARLAPAIPGSCPAASRPNSRWRARPQSQPKPERACRRSQSAPVASLATRGLTPRRTPRSLAPRLESLLN